MAICTRQDVKTALGISDAVDDLRIDVALATASVVLGRSALLIGVACGAAGFVILRHRSNISRLLAGTELRVGSGPKN